MYREESRLCRRNDRPARLPLSIVQSSVGAVPEQRTPGQATCTPVQDRCTSVQFEVSGVPRKGVVVQAEGAGVPETGKLVQLRCGAVPMEHRLAPFAVSAVPRPECLRSLTNRVVPTTDDVVPTVDDVLRPADDVVPMIASCVQRLVIGRPLAAGSVPPPATARAGTLHMRPSTGLARRRGCRPRRSMCPVQPGTYHARPPTGRR